MFTIDTTHYNKAKRIPYDPKTPCGYMPRPLGRVHVRSIIVHTTNGKKGTTLASEANYICNSRAISAHYLIGKQGEIIQFLDPSFYIAYHAGCVRSTLFTNVFAIGIEMHNTPTEGPCTILQIEALTWLVKQLYEKYTIPELNIETHRKVAVYCPGHKLAGQTGRKIDPSGLPDSIFYSWRAALYNKPTMTKYKVVASKVNIRTSPQINDTNIVGQLVFGDTFESVATVKDELGQTISGKNTWMHLTKGTHNGMRLDGLGFIHASNLIIVG